MNFKMPNVFWFSVFLSIGLVHGYCGSGGCIFSGQNYDAGVQVEIGCFYFTCTKTDNWAFDGINGSCARCLLTNDPHFVTFDGFKYDFHGHCNYSISQPIGECDKELSYNPPYGIFGDFLQCQPPWQTATCLDKTTYKISDDLSIVIKHDNLELEGIIPTTDPIAYYDCSYFDVAIIWKDINDGCINIVGPYYSIHACTDSMVIYTVRNHLYQIGGLCGYYSGIIYDDEFLLRDCSFEDLAQNYPFGENWRTMDQTDRECIQGDPLIDPPIYDCDVPTANEICYSIIMEAYEICPDGFTEEDFGRVNYDCVEDCCLNGNENCEKWGLVGRDFLCTLTNLNNQIIGKEAKK